MSFPTTLHRAFYRDLGNAITAAKLYDPNGAEINAAISDGTNDPVGFKSIVFSTGSMVEAVAMDSTFQNPNDPQPVYLCYATPEEIVNGTITHWDNVLDNSLFDNMAPGRPTPFGNQIINYTGVGGENPAMRTWTLRPPEQFTPKIRQRTKDALTGVKLYGNDFSMLWYGVSPNAIQVQCDVEDITDPAGFVDVAYTNVTTYAESSVGMSLVKLTEEIIPQDGFSHALKFRVRYHCGGDVSEWVEGAWQQATYILPAPNPPASVSAVVLRDRADVIPDRVRVEWQWAATDPGDAVEIYAIDYLGKKHLLGEETDNAVTSLTVENVSRFVTQETGPATQSAYRFGVISKNRSSKSDLTTSTGTVLLTNKVKDITPPTPDEIAGTAETASYSTLLSKINAAVQASNTYTADMKAAFALMATGVVNTVFDTIKDVVMKGGNVTVDDFGVFRAKWKDEYWGRNPSTGDPVLVPAQRGQAFSPSAGYKVGTKYGVILTDPQAKTYTP